MLKFNKSGCIVCGRTTFKNPEISLHRFPSDLAKRYMWIEACKLENTIFNVSSKICSLHFKPDCFKKDCQRRILTPRAVPTIFKNEEIEENKKNMIPKMIFKRNFKIEKGLTDYNMTEEKKIPKIIVKRNLKALKIENGITEDNMMEEKKIPKIIVKRNLNSLKIENGISGDNMMEEKKIPLSLEKPSNLKRKQEDNSSVEVNKKQVVNKPLFCPSRMYRYDNTSLYKTIWICRGCLAFILSQERVRPHIAECKEHRRAMGFDESSDSEDSE